VDKDRVIPKKNQEEPMDIVDPREEAEQIASHKNKVSLE
jgi:hypothetical protein